MRDGFLGFEVKTKQPVASRTRPKRIVFDEQTGETTRHFRRNAFHFACPIFFNFKQRRAACKPDFAAVGLGAGVKSFRRQTDERVERLANRVNGSDAVGLEQNAPVFVLQTKENKGFDSG